MKRGHIALLIGIAVVTSLAIYAHWSTNSAKQEAGLLCEQIALGSDIDSIVQSAKSNGINTRYDTGASEQVFKFPGFIYNAGICAVKVTDGRVESKRSYLYELD